MTALVLPPAAGAAIVDAVKGCYAAREIPCYWLPLLLPIKTGEFAGMVAIDLGPDAQRMAMRNGDALADLPDYKTLMASLGEPVFSEVKESDLGPAIIMAAELPPEKDAEETGPREEGGFEAEAIDPPAVPSAPEQPLDATPDI